MTPFEFVAVFFSVLVGLGVAQMLGSIADLVEAKARVRIDWIHAVWTSQILLLLAHSWWGMWTLTYKEAWTYPDFGLVAAGLALVYLLSSLILPRVSGDDATIDLGAHFSTVRTVFLSVLTCYFVFASVINWHIFGTPAIGFFTISPFALALFTLSGVFIKARVWQATIVVVLAIVIAIFMSLDTTVLT